MGYVEEVIAAAILGSFKELADILFRGTINTAMESVNHVLTFMLPSVDVNPIGDMEFSVFLLVVMLALIYYPFRKVVLEGLLRRSRTNIDWAKERGIGIMLTLIGPKLYWVTNSLSIGITGFILMSIDLGLIFPPYMIPFYLPFVGVATLALSFSMLVYMFVLVLGLLSVRSLGFILFVDCGNNTAKQITRLIFANQGYPLLLVGTVKVFQVVLMVGNLPIGLVSMVPILFSAASFFLLVVLYILVWDWNVEVSKQRYRTVKKMIWKTAETAAAAKTGGLSRVAATVVSLAPGKNEEENRPIEKRGGEL